MFQQGQLRLLGNTDLGHNCRVSHSFKHVIEWVSMLLILSWDVSVYPGPKTSLLTGSTINIRSTRNNSVVLEDFTNSNKCDVITVTETWLPLDDPDISVHLSMGKAQDIIFHTVYRPTNVSKANFMEDYSYLVESTALSYCENIIWVI